MVTIDVSPVEQSVGIYLLMRPCATMYLKTSRVRRWETSRRFVSRSMTFPLVFGDEAQECSLEELPFRATEVSILRLVQSGCAPPSTSGCMHKGVRSQFFRGCCNRSVVQAKPTILWVVVAQCSPPPTRAYPPALRLLLLVPPSKQTTDLKINRVFPRSPLVPGGRMPRGAAFTPAQEWEGARRNAPGKMSIDRAFGGRSAQETGAGRRWGRDGGHVVSRSIPRDSYL